MSGREDKLPKWAQEKLGDLRRTINGLCDELENTRAAHAVLESRDWFTLPNPVDSEDEIRKLFWLSRDGAHAACSLGRGDVLLVGRARQKGAAGG